jgi:riboflavin synthase
MFTGLIETVGHVSGITPASSGFRLSIRTTLVADLTPGESVAVNGVCLTVTGTDRDVLHADIGPETARVTTLGALRPDQRVNLERSMRADARFGGHFVQGHVDATATVEGLRSDGEAHWLTIGFPRSCTAVDTKGFGERGRYQPDGGGLARAQFDVMIIPFTWSTRTCRHVRPATG